MADYFTEFSEVIPQLKADEEAWLRDQLQMIHVVSGREYTTSSIPVDLAGREPEWQGRRFLRDIEHPEDCAEDWPGFAHEFRDDEDTADGWGRHLWLHDDEGARLDCVVHLVQKFLRRFRPHECWSLSYASVCSAPRVGEFGGGGIVVTANDVLWLDAASWVVDQRVALQRQAREAPPEATT